jgi:hypothetical protein
VTVVVRNVADLEGSRREGGSDEAENGIDERRMFSRASITM